MFVRSGMLHGIAIALACSSCLDVVAVGTVVGNTTTQYVTFDHGEAFDTMVLRDLKRRERALFARCFLYMPAREWVEWTMVWDAIGAHDRHRSVRPSGPGRVHDLADKVLSKYELVGAMVERRGLAQQVDIVAPEHPITASTQDLRIYVRLPTKPPAQPKFPDPGRRKAVVAATVVGIDGFEIFGGRGSVLLREDPTIAEFKPRMLELLARLENAAVRLEGSH